MRQKSQAMMERICDFVEDFYVMENRFPSTTEIAEAVGMARGTVYKYLVAMDERGMISYDGSVIMTDRLQQLSALQSARVYSGSIPCGTPEDVDASVEDYISLPVSIFGSDEMYVLRTKGSSMIEAGIDEGDYVVIRKQQTAKVGDIIVALHNNENTLKTLGFNEETRRYVLHPENASMEDIEIDELTVQGVAKFVIKSL